MIYKNIMIIKNYYIFFTILAILNLKRILGYKKITLIKPDKVKINTDYINYTLSKKIILKEINLNIPDWLYQQQNKQSNIFSIKFSELKEEMNFLNKNLKTFDFNDFNDKNGIDLIKYQKYLLNNYKKVFRIDYLLTNPNYYFNLDLEFKFLMDQISKKKSRKIEIKNNFMIFKKLNCFKETNFISKLEKLDNKNYQSLFFRNWNFISLFFRYINKGKLDEYHFLGTYILNNYIRIIFKFLEFYKFKIKFNNIKIINTTDFNNNKKNDKKFLYNLKDEFNKIYHDFIENIRIKLIDNNLLTCIEEKENTYIFQEKISKEIYDLSLFKLIKVSKNNFLYTSFKIFMLFEKYCIECLILLFEYSEKLKKFKDLKKLKDLVHYKNLKNSKDSKDSKDLKNQKNLKKLKTQKTLKNLKYLKTQNTKKSLNKQVTLKKSKYLKNKNPQKTKRFKDLKI